MIRPNKHNPIFSRTRNGTLLASSSRFVTLKSENGLTDHKFVDKLKKMEFFLEEGKQANPNCSTLILPALSIGNVGQLAVDLLISSLKAERIGYMDDPNVLPCVGNDAYTASPGGDLALPLEAYDASSSGLTIVQQRSPVIKGMMIEYAKNLASFAASNGKKHVIILSSLDFGRWKSVDMSSGLQIHYLSSSNMDGSDNDCERFGWKRLQDFSPVQSTWKHLNELAEEGSIPDEDFSFEELGDDDYYPSLPFAALFSVFKARGIKVTCLLCYCSEGDNIPEAFCLAEATSKLVGLSYNETDGGEASKWTIPFSWQSVYGPPADMTLF